MSLYKAKTRCTAEKTLQLYNAKPKENTHGVQHTLAYIQQNGTAAAHTKRSSGKDEMFVKSVCRNGMGRQHGLMLSSACPLDAHFCWRCATFVHEAASVTLSAVGSFGKESANGAVSR